MNRTSHQVRSAVGHVEAIFEQNVLDLSAQCVSTVACHAADLALQRFLLDVHALLNRRVELALEHEDGMRGSGTAHVRALALPALVLERCSEIGPRFALDDDGQEELFEHLVLKPALDDEQVVAKHKLARLHFDLARRSETDQHASADTPNNDEPSPREPSRRAC